MLWTTRSLWCLVGACSKGGCAAAMQTDLSPLWIMPGKNNIMYTPYGTVSESLHADLPLDNGADCRLIQ